MFDPNSFLNSNTTASTERVLIPLDRGDMFIGIITELTAKNGTSASGRLWARLDLKVQIEDSYVKETLMIEKVVRVYGIMLDLTDEGQYDSRKGKNINLGLAAKALGLDPSDFTPHQFIGQTAKFRIGYEVYNGKEMDKIIGVVPV